MNLYKIETKSKDYFFEAENMIVTSVYNSELEKFIGQNIMTVINICAMKGYSFEKTEGIPQK